MCGHLKIPVGLELACVDPSLQIGQEGPECTWAPNHHLLVGMEIFYM